MRLVMFFFLSLLFCIITFGVIYIRASILARVPGEDWLLGFVLTTVIVIPLFQALIFFGWGWIERALFGGKGFNFLKAIVLGVVAGILVSLLSLYTDLF
jgi:hypothetical protein